MPRTTRTPSRRSVAAPTPSGLRVLPDDSLGTLVVATVIAELRWTPDVAPLVVDRLARDAVAYPEQLARSPVAPDARRRAGPAEGTGRRGMRLLLTAVLAALVATVAVLVAGAGRTFAADPSSLAIGLEPFVDGLESPVHVTTAGDGTAELYVVEQGGRIRVVDAAGAIQPEPFLDISDGVIAGGEQGLLGLAFHPDYPQDPRIFVDYTRREDGGTIVSEFQVVEGRADPRSQRILLSIEQPYANHNGGTIAFDDAGYLLVGMGDGGGGGDPFEASQDPTSLLGKLLRIDIDAGDPYAIPPDNGYVADPAYRPEIHASGLRNPWRFSVDPEGGHIYIADVGQNAFEEVSVLVGGAGGVSLGWNRFEGDQCFSEPCDPADHLAPSVTYPHEKGCTIVGGDVYRGTLQPALEGIYLFGDLCSGRIWAADAAAMLEGTVTPAEVGQMDGTLVAFGQTVDGEPLAVDHGGRLLRVLAEGGAPASRSRTALLSAASAGPAAPDPLGAEAEAEPSPVASPEPTFDPASVALRPVLVIDGLDEPVMVTGDGTGSGLLYIVERPGVIRVIDETGLRDPLLDISERVSIDGERGLHSVAFHPDYEDNGRFFVHYNDLDGNARIEEYRTRRGRVVGRGRTILEVEQPFINNKGGPILFGPDGFLYVALGDGGGSSPGDPMGFGQRRDSLLAKILRIDVDARRGYRVPRDNPFTSRRERRQWAPETWVYGLRDPRGVSIDPGTGDLWIGDRGQDRFEEIDLAPSGESGLNFGWSAMEGASCHLDAACDPADYTLPVYTYDQVPPDCGVVGGHVYRGEAIVGLRGAYVFTDRCSGIIRALDAAAVRDGQPASVVSLLDGDRGWRAFGIDDDGELYLTSLDGGVYRLEAESVS